MKLYKRLDRLKHIADSIHSGQSLSDKDRQFISRALTDIADSKGPYETQSAKNAA